MEKYVILSDGRSSHTLKWAKELQNHYDVYIITFTNFTDEFVQAFSKEKLYSLAINIDENGGNHKVLMKIPAIVDIIRKINPYIINAHYITSYGLIAAMIKKFYKVSAILVLSAWGTDILVTPYKNKLYWYITRFALGQADIITSDSHAMSDEIKYISGKQALTFPFGLETFPNCSIENKDELLYFSNRSLSENYNIDKVLIFFSRLVSGNIKRKLIIANNGPMRQELWKLTDTLGITENVEFVGFLNKEQQSQIYSKSQFYISIPTSDATSVSLLEAMAFGCIPIVSNIPSNREWVINNFNGLYFSEVLDCVEEILEKKEKIFDSNRCIIKDNALWTDNIKLFIEMLKLKVLE